MTLHIEWIGWVRADSGKPHKRPNLPVGSPSERELQIKDHYLHGKTLCQIGEKFCVTRERIRQILKNRFGITGKNGGKFVQVTAEKIASGREKVERLKKRHEYRYLTRFKCSESEFLAINKSHWTWKMRKDKSPAAAYIDQMRNAIGFRHIEWEITFPEWWKIWQDSGRWEQRGRGKGYCMARIGDTGPYSKENVYICSGSQNSFDARMNSWIRNRNCLTTMGTGTMPRQHASSVSHRKGCRLTRTN